MSERVWLYVAQGKEETVLLDLQKSTQTAGDLLGQPGRLTRTVGVQDAKKQKLMKQSLEERSKFYAALDRENLPLDLLIRLGKLFAAADGGISLDHPGGQIPNWLQYLLNDALYASFNEWRPEDHPTKPGGLRHQPCS